MINRIKDYFSFSRNEQRGLIVLLGLLLLSLSANFLIPFTLPEKKFDIRPFEAEVEKFLAEAEKSEKSMVTENEFHSSDAMENTESALLKGFRASPFYFDPNLMTEEQWNETGLDPKITRNIISYREKGGKFRNAEGFRKIYGMTDAVFSILEPYITIETKPAKSFNDKHSESPGEKKKEQFTVDEDAFSLPIIELNSADSIMLTSLPGIGPYYASGILKYRARLGGFCRKEQLLEIRGIDSNRYVGLISRISIDTGMIRKMDINNVTFKEMMKHPYFEYYLVKAIFSRKDELKAYDSVEQIKYLPVMYRELYDKISPYLSAGKAAESIK